MKNYLNEILAQLVSGYPSFDLTGPDSDIESLLMAILFFLKKPQNPVDSYATS